MSDTAEKPEEWEDEVYTYADYLEWDGPERYELIDGRVFMMGSPTVAHQEINGELFGQFREFLKGKPCRVYAAPLDVRLFPEEKNMDKTVVQPDLLVICDRSKLSDGKACKGPPDLIIEIVSPSNTEINMLLKYNQYRKAGVKEYWVVYPGQRSVFVYILENGEYVKQFYEGDDVIPVSALPGFSVDLKPVWAAMEAVPTTHQGPRHVANT